MLRSALPCLLAVPVLAVAAGAPPSGAPGSPPPQPSGPGPVAGDSKPTALPANSVQVTEQDGVRTITSNGIPDHVPGRFPSRGNPNTIGAQQYAFRMTMAPAPSGRLTKHGHDWAGVAVNGVPFEPGTAEAWKNDPSTGWHIEGIQPAAGGPVLGMDANNAHVQPNGAYHYHGVPTGMLAKLAAAKGTKVGQSMLLIGWAADGFPIYDFHAYAKADDATSPLKELHSSWRLRKGERPGGDAGPGGAFDGTYTEDYEFVAGSGDLDECNGRTGVTPEFPKGTYYYVVTAEFPFVTRALKGERDPSFSKGPPGGRRGGPGGSGGPPGGRRRGGRGPGGPGGRGGPGGPGAPPPQTGGPDPVPPTHG